MKLKLCIGSIVILLLGIVIAQQTWFGVSTLNFLSGGQELSTVSLSLTESRIQTGFWVRITNPSDQSLDIKLGFADQTTPDSSGNVGCDMVGVSQVVQGLSWNSGLLTVPASGFRDEWVAMNYPACLSGAFAGCAVQLAATPENMGSFDFQAGKVNLFSVTMAQSPLCSPFSIKIFPGSRAQGNYSVLGELRFYTMTGKQLMFSGQVVTNSAGIGVLTGYVAPGQYYIVYKGQSHLASYLSGVTIIQGEQMTLDFTTGSVLYNTQLAGTQDDGFRYQIAGDLKNTAGKYDFVINGNDISTLVFGSGFTVGVSPLDPKNLDANTDIGSADISIIGFNYLHIDPFASSAQQLFSW